MTTFFPAISDLTTLMVLGVVVFGAGFVRGFSGFGFSAITVAAMSIIMPPLTIIAMVMLFEIAASAFQVTKIYRHIEKPLVGRLLLGALLAMPVGVALLVALDVDMVRIVIASIILVMCLLLFSGWTLKTAPGPVGQFGVGVISGFANSTAIGGLPVGLLLAAQNTEPEKFRANMIGYLFALDIIGITVMAFYGKFTIAIVITAASLFPLMMAGVVLGSYRFFATPPKSFRRFVILLLICLSLAGLAKSFL
jgi:uncharacterized membrane protein YfcA